MNRVHLFPYCGSAQTERSAASLSRWSEDFAAMLHSLLEYGAVPEPLGLFGHRFLR